MNDYGETGAALLGAACSTRGTQAEYFAANHCLLAVAPDGSDRVHLHADAKCFGEILGIRSGRLGFESQRALPAAQLCGFV